MSMRPPVPKNKILLFTLVGALLTGAIAVGLAYPGLSSAGDDGDAQAADGSVDTPADAPEPNENFTPEVADSGYEEHEEESEYDEEDEEYEGDEEYDGDGHEEQNEYENDEHD